MAVITGTGSERLLPSELPDNHPLNVVFLPQDMYDKIFEIIASTHTPLTSIVAFGSVTRGFRARYLQPSPIFPMMNALSCIYTSMPIASAPLTSPLPHLDQRFLAADASGNQYYCSKWCHARPVLYIINPSHKRLLILDMDEQNLGDKKTTDLSIVDCYPIEQGFILVCHAGVGQWHFTDDHPKPILAWYKDFTYWNKCIQSSSLFNNRLYLTIPGHRKLPFIRVLDLPNAPDLPSLWPVFQVDYLSLGAQVLGNKYCKFLNFNNQTYAFAEKDDKELSTVV
ncbi:MAG TPA: hypothetical protein VIH61_04915, partial [Waddliaceae bacterium]